MTSEVLMHDGFESLRPGPIAEAVNGPVADIVNEVNTRVEAGLNGVAQGTEVALAGALDDGVGVGASQRGAGLLDGFREIAGAVGGVGDEQRPRARGGRLGFIGLDLVDERQELVAGLDGETAHRDFGDAVVIDVAVGGVS